MARTSVPTVVAGQKITATQGNKYSAGITELQEDLPESWSTWSSPTVAGLTKGNGTEVAAHYTIAGVTFCYYRFILGSTSAVTGDLQLTTPTSMIYGGVFAGGGSYFEDTGTSRYPMHVASIGTSLVLLRPILTSETTPICSVRMSSAQSITDATNTTLNFNTEDIDPLNWHDNATNNSRITPTIAGWYEVTYSTDWQSDTDYTRLLVSLQKNGTNPSPLPANDVIGGAAVTTPNLSGAFPPIQMNGTTDYFEIFVFQTNTSAGANTCDAKFCVKLVAPTTQPNSLYAKSATACSATVPFTWTTSDEIVAMFAYRNV